MLNISCAEDENKEKEMDNGPLLKKIFSKFKANASPIAFISNFPLVFTF